MLHRAHLTVEQDNGLLERQGVPDLHLAEGTLQDSRRKKEHKGCSLLDALQHALLGQVVSAVVIPRLEAHALELKVDGIGLVLGAQEEQRSHEFCVCMYVLWMGAHTFLVAACALAVAVDDGGAGGKRQGGISRGK